MLKGKMEHRVKEAKRQPYVKSMFNFKKTQNEVLKLLLYHQIKRIQELEKKNIVLEKKLKSATKCLHRLERVCCCKCENWAHMDNCDGCRNCPTGFCDVCNNLKQCARCKELFCDACLNNGKCPKCARKK